MCVFSMFLNETKVGGGHIYSFWCYQNAVLTSSRKWRNKQCQLPAATCQWHASVDQPVTDSMPDTGQWPRGRRGQQHASWGIPGTRHMTTTRECRSPTIWTPLSGCLIRKQYTGLHAFLNKNTFIRRTRVFHKLMDGFLNGFRIIVYGPPFRIVFNTK